MWEHDATEMAYRHGYEKGYEAGKKDAVVHGHKAESAISKTGLICTACYSDVDRDAVFCKYCGAKMDLED